MVRELKITRDPEAGSGHAWQLERPARAALPNSYFWTWDHSCNWVLDDPGLQTSGCYNRYFKRPETFLEDYRQVTDLAAGLGIRGFTVAGFLRDSHGGVESAKRVAAYAASRGVAAMPCFGTNWYQGPYYEGNHRYNLSVFLDKHPEARILDQKGEPRTFNGEYGASPAHPAFRQWLADGLGWLAGEFEIGGLNIENGDMLEDYSPATQAMRPTWPADDPEPFFFQGLCYQAALEAVRRHLRDKIITYATYTGFSYTDKLVQNTGMGPKPPAMLAVLPDEAIAQWTLTGMLFQEPLPLTSYLEDGAPKAAFDNPAWPDGLTPPCRRSVGFAHQGSQWSHIGRYECTVSTIKEACLRAHRCGLEGVAIHGEVTSRYIPCAVNYLAFSHFVHWPEDSMRQFARKTLAQVLGSPKDAEDFVVVLCHWDAGTLTDDLRKLSHWSNHGFADRTCASNCQTTEEFRRFRFWEWLHTVATRNFPRHSSTMFPL